MATETLTSDGVVFKSEEDAILLKDSTGEPWKSYLKYGRNYESVRPPIGQAVRVHYRPWENPSTGKVSYYLNEVEVLGPPPEDGAAPPAVPAPGAAPVYSYQGSHDAAQARADRPVQRAASPPRAVTWVNQSYEDMHDAAAARVTAEPDVAAAVQQSGSGAVPNEAFPSPVPGEYAFRDLSIQRQNRLNVSVQALIANLENCPPEDKANRMITPWSIAEFERFLVEGAVYDDGTRPDYQPPPEDLPGGP